MIDGNGKWIRTRHENEKSHFVISYKKGND